MKLSWLKRYLKSKGKWTVFPNDFELWEVFSYGPDILDKLLELTSNKCWLDVLRSLEYFWKTDAILNEDFIKNTPIWLNPNFSIPINKNWFNHGVTSIADFLGTMNVILPMEDFMSRFNVKTNFLDYNYVTVKIKKYIEWQDLPLHGEELPRNSSLNVFLNLSNKGVSRIYSRMKESFSHVLDNAVEIWTRNIDIDIEIFCLSKSFHYHHLKYKDTYLKYIQFRTLHHRFYTNEKLHKMGIKNSDQCSFCLSCTDSVEHMLIQCHISRELWGGVRDWIVEIGMPNYNLSDARIILGDMENAVCINSIILLTKKVIYNVMKKEQKPHIAQVKNDVKKFYFEEKYRHYIQGKGCLFDKQYFLLNNFYAI